MTLIGCSLSFYNAIQYKFTTRVQAVATAIDTHLVSRDVVALTPQIDELMVSVDIVRIELLQGEHVVYDHSRTSSYRPAGTNNLYRGSPYRWSSIRACHCVWFIRIRWVTISIRY